eukprot:SAG31_NODE_260_length_18915_cov_3.432823_10_plen_203_part_00
MAAAPNSCPPNCSENCGGPHGVLCCNNPGGRWHQGPKGEQYPYFGRPCSRQSDCGQCAVDATCTCTTIAGQPKPMIGCCMRKSTRLDPATSNSMPIVTIHYEMYQGLPSMSKRVSLATSSPHCVTISGLMVERLAFQETHLGRNSHFDTDWAWFQGNRVSLFTSYARNPQYPCQTGRQGWVSGCSGGAGVFGIIKDLNCAPA